MSANTPPRRCAEPPAHDAAPIGLVAALRSHIDELEVLIDRLARFEAFSVAKMRANGAEPWRREAMELRARLSVLL